MPAMLRLGLIESVRRMALRTVQRLDELENADRWAERVIAASEEGPARLGAVFDEFIADHPPLTSDLRLPAPPAAALRAGRLRAAGPARASGSPTRR